MPAAPIQLTPAARDEIARLQASREQTDCWLRLSVEAGGCAGWVYSLALVPECQPSDRCCQSNGIAIAIEAASERYLDGLRIDYSEDLMGGSFHFDNSAASETCGCGHSFALGPSEAAS
ncbi:MAG: iron-sulfur cluster assembly accessory protein [Cyanobacteria bacterium QS_8_64_29]|nr:MAG: iron-sulfur cluster assembly accessory protein [Cyanobacteria bacterium QS_8_64_29]